jgi:membrane protease YdiL (CAAX protease family)
LQSLAEELLIRGYIMQGLGLFTRRAWIPVLASSLIFTLLHLSNPEAQTDTLLSLGSYLTAGLLFAMVAVKDNRLELAIGMHVANNVFVLVANNAVSALPVPPIFTVGTLDAGYNLLSSLVIAFIFYAGLSFFKKTDKAHEPALK